MHSNSFVFCFVAVLLGGGGSSILFCFHADGVDETQSIPAPAALGGVV